MSNFSFLQNEWLAIHDSATKAESYLNSDCRAACWYARMGLEQMVAWLYQHDANFKCYEESLGARVYDPSFRKQVGESIFTKATVVISIGNRAAHAKASQRADAMIALTELFHIAFWLARTYSTRLRPNPALQFNPALIPPVPQAAVSLAELRKQESLVNQQQAENAALKAKLAGFEQTDKQLVELRAEIAKAKAANQAEADSHDYNEEQTRDYFIDVLLKEAGWLLDKPEDREFALRLRSGNGAGASFSKQQKKGVGASDKPQDREFEVAGMPNDTGIGYVDYVLWGDDGKPLALVEAKRSRRDARVGQQQAKLYADCLEARYQRRPVIYYSNGYEHWFWDDTDAAPRRVEGFHKKDELALLMQRRTSRTALAGAAINVAIAGRSYQQQAIRSVTEQLEQYKQRRSLLVMATGAGKTRTVIALADLLVQCNWAKRILFLADRVSLVKQACKAFVNYAPNLGAVNLLDNAESTGRVFVSTYPTMLNLINDTGSGVRRFGIGYFDVVIVDEAHRSIYAKYGALFSYFDSYLIGLTATPKDEVERDTYRLFELEKGVPTYAYGLEEAIADGYLVPPRALSVPLKFVREGIKYADLSEAERQQWDELDWGDDEPPQQVDPAALNNWLFNTDTVDGVLQHLMMQGERVASGDRLGKTIIFAKNNAHADFIAERFNANYPEYKGQFARVITYKTEYAQSLIDGFSVKNKLPHIAISVDMLDTGIDIPEVVNLVFFKLVRSKTKFWQMIGRGTRLCPDLYAPGQHKQFFNVFDYCQNIEYFNGYMAKAEPAIADSLETRLFKARVDLLTSLDAASPVAGIGEAVAEYGGALRKDTADTLHSRVANMTLDNFMVRPKRLYVEKYAQREQWDKLTVDEAGELTRQVAALPSQLRDPEEEAKRFDLLVLRCQLCILQGNTGFDRAKASMVAIAEALELQESIPAVRNQMLLIQSLLTEEWWQDVTVAMLEQVRRQLRLLVKLIEKSKRPIVYTDFDDEIGAGTAVDLPLKAVGLDYERFKNKTRDFLRQHEDRLAVQKLRRNLPITPTDLAELENILLEQAVNDNGLVEQARQEAGGLGLFVRSLVGLERSAAVKAMSEFLNDATATSRQLSFVKMIVECLTSNGAMTEDLLYNAPFTDIAATGPEGIFPVATVQRLDEVIREIRQRAVA